MIEKAEIIGPYKQTGIQCHHYVHIVFDDGSYVSLNEEDLRNAAIIARQNALVDDKRQREGCLNE